MFRNFSSKNIFRRLSIGLGVGVFAASTFAMTPAQADYYTTYFNSMTTPFIVHSSPTYDTVTGGRVNGSGYGDGPYYVATQTINQNNSRIIYAEARGPSGAGFTYLNHLPKSDGMNRCWFASDNNLYNTPTFQQGLRCDVKFQS